MYEGKKPRRARQRSADRIRPESKAKSRRGPIETLRLRHDPRGTAKSERGVAGEIQSKVHGVNPWRAGKTQERCELRQTVKRRPEATRVSWAPILESQRAFERGRGMGREARKRKVPAARAAWCCETRRRKPKTTLTPMLRTAAMQSDVRQTQGLQLAVRQSTAPSKPAQAGKQVALPTRTGEGTFRSGVSAWSRELGFSGPEFRGPAGRT